jgi:diguanylate cyclase (GGDEF)-like protein
MDLARLPRPSDDQDEPFVPDFSEGVESGLYLAVLELLEEGLIIASDEQVLEVNSAACRLLERSYGELAGRPLAELFPSEQAFLAARARLFIQGQMRGSLQLALPGGRHRDMRFCAAARLRPGLHALVLSPDSLAEAGATSRAADTLWPRLAAALEQPVIVVDEADRVVAANTAALRRLKLARSGLVGQRLDERVEVYWPAPGAEPVARLRPSDGEAQTARILPGPKPGWRLLILPPQREAAGRPAAPPLGATPAPPSASAGVSGGAALDPSEQAPLASDRQGDLAARQRTGVRSDDLTRHDALTGLPRLRQLGERFAEAQGRARHQHSHIAILKIHADQLKTVNERFGHEFGDRLLQQLAQRLRTALPPPALVARKRGDAFVALIPDLHLLSEVGAATRALGAALAQPLSLDGRTIELAANIGVAVFPGDGNGLETLLRHAEVAREDARQAGGGVRFYTDEINSRGLEQRALEASLRHAIERRELEIHFVPEWRGSEPLAAEALLRWRHADLGLIPSRRLLPLLRQGGLLASFGAWALGQACAQAARWAGGGRDVSLVVNVALEQLADPAFPALLRSVLADSGLPPQRLELDLEETLLSHGEETHLAALRSMAELGVGLAIDNFGEGLSSISRLGSLPLTTLRLAPALVRDSLAAPTGPAVLEATLAMAQALRLRVVAKGVDNASQRTRLVDMGFAALQGGHIGGPLDAAEFARTHLGPGLR